jgi:ring-1,2-phenylacetyl-CoA epoxidase subunit PaaE
MTVASRFVAGATRLSATARFHTLTVAEVEPLTEDAVAVTFDVPDDLADEFAFTPGQSLTLRRVVDGPDGPTEQRRQYSISAPAGARPRVGVREIPDGLFSRWLVRDVRPGDVIEVQTPSGRFCPDPALLQGGRHLCIAAGSGITPMLSVASSVLADGGEVALLYGNRTSASVMFAEELADLKNRFGPQLQLVHVLSREPRDVELFSGRLDADRLRRLLTTLVPADRFDHVWLCGPHTMLLAAQAVLAELGVPRARVHFELFYVDEPPPELVRADAEVSGETSEVTVVLDGLSTTAPVLRERTVLDGAQTMRSDLPFACKGGVCGTCRARVVEGEVDMRRNYALEPAEVEAGFVLTCQSYPVGDAVTVDYDA